MTLAIYLFTIFNINILYTNSNLCVTIKILLLIPKGIILVSQLLKKTNINKETDIKEDN